MVDNKRIIDGEDVYRKNLSAEEKHQIKRLRQHHFEESYDDISELTKQELKYIITTICDEVDQLMIALFKESPDTLDMSSDHRYQAVMKEYKVYADQLIKLRSSETRDKKDSTFLTPPPHSFELLNKEKLEDTFKQAELQKIKITKSFLRLLVKRSYNIHYKPNDGVRFQNYLEEVFKLQIKSKNTHVSIPNDRFLTSLGYS